MGLADAARVPGSLPRPCCCPLLSLCFRSYRKGRGPPDTWPLTSASPDPTPPFPSAADALWRPGSPGGSSVTARAPRRRGPGVAGAALLRSDPPWSVSAR